MLTAKPIPHTSLSKQCNSKPHAALHFSEAVNRIPLKTHSHDRVLLRDCSLCLEQPKAILSGRLSPPDFHSINLKMKISQLRAEKYTPLWTVPLINYINQWMSLFLYHWCCCPLCVFLAFSSCLNCLVYCTEKHTLKIHSHITFYLLPSSLYATSRRDTQTPIDLYPTPIPNLKPSRMIREGKTEILEEFLLETLEKATR